MATERIELNGLCVEADRDGRLAFAIGDVSVDLDADDSLTLAYWLRENRMADRLERAIMRANGLLEEAGQC